jgi:formimidoylglutamate deiminase
MQTNLLEDARLLEFQTRSGRERAAMSSGDLAATWFHAATVAGARSLGAPGGAIEIGRPADFFTVDLYDPSLIGAAPENLLGAVVFASTPRAVREVWVGARQRVGRWRHSLQSAIIARFGEMQKRLWSS